jgi:hypothetical protein
METAMLEYSAPESMRAEIEYRRQRARELARPMWIEQEVPSLLSWLFRRHGTSDGHDGKAAHRAA